MYVVLGCTELLHNPRPQISSRSMSLDSDKPKGVIPVERVPTDYHYYFMACLAIHQVVQYHSLSRVLCE